MDSRVLIWDIVKISREHRKRVEKKICTLGIHPSQHHLLMYLSCNGPTTQNAIAEAMEVSASTIAVSLRKLENGGYVTKENTKEDARAKLVVLTKKGEDVVFRSKCLFEEIDRETFDILTEEEKEKLHEYMERIIQNIAE